MHRVNEDSKRLERKETVVQFSRVFFAWILSLVFVTSSFAAHASDECRGLSIEIDRRDEQDPRAQYARDQICSVIRKSYSNELTKTRISVGLFRSKDTTNFRAVPTFSRLWGRDRGYRILIDPTRTMDSASPISAHEFRSILAHELAHVIDYQRRDISGLLGLAQIAWSAKARSRLEHWADYASFYAGYRSGERYLDGAISHEYWVRAQTDQQARTYAGGGGKFPTYMEPRTLESIRDFADGLLISCPDELDRFFARLLRELPILESEIAEFLNAFSRQSACEPAAPSVGSK